MVAPSAAAESNFASRSAANVSLGNRACWSTSAACFAATSSAIAAVLVTSGFALTDDRVVTVRRYHQLPAHLAQAVLDRDVALIPELASRLGIDDCDFTAH